MEEDSLSLPHLIINHMIKAIEPIKFTCNVPYGMLLTLVFKHFGVSLDGERVNGDVLSQGAKNVAALKLSSQLGMEKAYTCFDEEEAQNKKTQQKEKKDKVSPLLTELVRSKKTMKYRVDRSPLSERIIQEAVVEAFALENEISKQIEKTARKESSKGTQTLGRTTKGNFKDAQNETQRRIPSS